MEEKKTEKTTYQKVIDGEITPEGCQKGWSNLKEGQQKHNFAVIDSEKLSEISRKGAAAVNKLHGEKRTAKQALEKILTLKVNDAIIAGADLEPELAERLKRDNPDATIYDLVQLVAVGRAVGGNMKAYELIRDTYGDKPIERVEVSENITTEADREMMRAIAARLENGEKIEVVKDVNADQENGK